MLCGVSENLMSELQCIFAKYPQIERVVIFGSRARGEARYNSDIDLAIFSESGVSGQMYADIDEAAGIYKVDIIDAKNVTNEKLIQNIFRDGIEIYSRRRLNHMNKSAKIYVAGHRGLVGSAIIRKLQREGYHNILTAARQEVDLLSQQAVAEFFAKEKPEYVFLAAAKVGGIMANSSYPADFIYENLMIEAHIIHESFKNGVKKLLFLGSSCIYPKMAEQPIKEDSLLTGPLEPTNDAYALAKIAGIKMCQAYNKQYGTEYISVMPTNLYGPNDNFDLESSHVLPALIRKFHEAKLSNASTVTVWGTGTPIREFLYVDDLADACLYLMNTYSDSKIVNIGTGVGVTIRKLAEKISEAVGYQGEIVFDTSKPDGTPIKINDVSYLKQLGWQAKVDLAAGIKLAYNWFQEKV